MNKHSYIAEIMTDRIIVANLNSSLVSLLEFFSEWKIQHLPVESYGKLVGIVSINDILHFIYQKVKADSTKTFDQIASEFGAVDIMTQNPIALSPNDKIETALKILAEGKFQAIPITLDGEIRGIITNKDLVRFFNKVG